MIRELARQLFELPTRFFVIQIVQRVKTQLAKFFKLRAFSRSPEPSRLSRQSQKRERRP